MIFSPFQTLYKTQSVCTHRSSNIHGLYSGNTRRSDHGNQNFNFTYRMYKDGLPSIFADLLPLGLLTRLVLSNNDPWHTHVQRDHRPVSSTECNKCTDSWSPSFQHSLQVLALMLTLSYYLWFLVPHCHSLKSCFLMLITTSLAGYWRNEKFCNQSNVLPMQNRSTLISTHFWNPLVHYACFLLHNKLFHSDLLYNSPTHNSKNLPLQNFPPSLWIASSFVAMHPQPPQIVIAAPPRP